MGQEESKTVFEVMHLSSINAPLVTFDPVGLSNNLRHTLLSHSASFAQN